MTRQSDLLTYFRPEIEKIIEIGALASPSIPQAADRVRYVDRLTTPELKEHYAGVAPQVVDKLVDVSYIWESGPLKPSLKDWYPVELVTASHVIEHVPNMVAWLNQLTDVLTPGGHISLAVPYKQKTFDLHRPVSTLGDVLEAWSTNAPRPGLRHVIDQRRYGVRVDGNNCWFDDPTPDRFSRVLPEIAGLNGFIDRWHAGDYVDSHVWVFTPDSFSEIIKDLNALELIALEICKGPTIYGHEFIVHLGRTNAKMRRSAGVSLSNTAGSVAPPSKDEGDLHSGERQVAPDMSGIRADHSARYAFGLDHLKGSLRGADIFCGTGYGSAMIAERGHTVIGIDRSADAIDYANDHYSTASTLYAVKSWPFTLAPDIFDFIFALESLEHVEDGLTFLKALAQALKPGGTLILSSPNQTLFPFQPDRHKFHMRHYTLEELTEMLKETGLSMENWGGQDIYDFTDGKQILLSEGKAPVETEKTGQFITMVARKR